MESKEELIKSGALVASKKGNNYHFDSLRIAEIMRERGVVFHKGRMYKYTGMGYREISRAELRSEVYRFDSLPYDPSTYVSCITTSKVNEIVRIWKNLWLNDPFDVDEVNKDPKYKGFLVSFRNGLYNVTTDELLPHTPKAFVMERFDFDYDPTVEEDPIRETYLSVIKGKDYDIFFTALGRTFFSCSTPTFAVVIHGRYGCGKSFLYHTVDNLCVQDSCIYFVGRDITLEDTPAYLVDKVANLTAFTKFSGRGQDVNVNTLFKLVRGDPVLSHRKFESKEYVSNSTPLWFKVEGPFSTHDFPQGLALRTYCVNCRFEQSQKTLFHSLCDQLEDVRSKQWVINEALRMFRKYGLTPFKYISENSVEAFLESIGDDPGIREYLDGEKVGDIYDDYLDCLDESEVPQSKKQFIDYVKSKYNMDTKHKSVRFGSKVTSINIFCKRK